MDRRKKKNLRAKGKTEAGTHVPILVDEVMSRLRPKVGNTVVDCTLGYGGHAKEFAGRIGKEGRLIGLDFDVAEMNKTAGRLAREGILIRCHRVNFGGVADVLKEEGVEGADVIFADVGVSSMQVDDSGRGISYKADGPLDMRMDGRFDKTGADVLAEIGEEELSKALWELSDEPDHEIIAKFIVGQRISNPITTVSELVRLVFNAKGMTERTWAREQKRAGFGGLHPAARTFQTIRILVNDELENLRKLLEAAPGCLKSGGRVGIISFHSGEDRLVKNAFRLGREQGIYSTASKEAIKPQMKEIVRNSRSASARFRWAQKA